MMNNYTLHGFITVNSLIDNLRNTVSPLGELSDDARSYASDKRYYTNESYDDIRLVVFRSIQDDTTDIEVPLAVRDLVIKIGAWMEDKSTDGTISSDNSVNRQAIYAEFKTEIEEIKLGKATTAKGYYLPQYIEFKLTDTDNYKDSLIKIWFSDDAFRNQYPYYEIRHLPPIDTLDDFFTTFTAVTALKNAISLAVIHDNANTIKQKSPYTIIKTEYYNWTDPNNEENTVPIPWTVLIYGGIGDNKDIIRDALATYILENSSRSREEWEKIFPDIFIPTEYIFAPVWTISSVPGYRTLGDMFSPNIRYADVLPFATEVMYGYSESHLSTNVEIMASLYKSLSMLVCGSERNRLGPISFYKMYPEYALIESRSLDFARMDSSHRTMIELLNTLLIYAETSEPDTELPLDIAKITRNNILYICKTMDGIQYLVAARYNYTSGNLTGGTTTATRN